MAPTTSMGASSPVSVVPLDAPHNEIEQLTLTEGRVSKSNQSNDNKETELEPWVCPASAKSLRTTNPIRAIVDPIVANIQSGEERGDGKDLISLAVRPVFVGSLLMVSFVASFSSILFVL